MRVRYVCGGWVGGVCACEVGEWVGACEVCVVRACEVCMVVGGWVGCVPVRWVGVVE